VFHSDLYYIFLYFEVSVMHVNAATPAPHNANVGVSKTDILRRLIDKLAVQGMLTGQRRQQLRELLVRIDLSAGSPFGQELLPSHWNSVTECLEAVRQETILQPAIDEDLQEIISNLQTTEVSWGRPLDLAGCRICGRTHQLKIKHLSFGSPDAWSYLSPADVQKRCEGDGNFLSIDRQRFFIRGILPVQIANQVVNIQMWAEVEHYYFAQFIDSVLVKTGQGTAIPVERKFKGVLANRLIASGENVAESINIVCGNRSLPTFWLSNSTAPLWRAQNGRMDSELMTMLFSQFAHSQFLQGRFMPSAPKLTA
jgi:hypothetical protein